MQNKRGDSSKKFLSLSPTTEQRFSDFSVSLSLSLCSSLSLPLSVGLFWSVYTQKSSASSVFQCSLTYKLLMKQQNTLNLKALFGFVNTMERNRLCCLFFSFTELFVCHREIEWPLCSFRPRYFTLCKLWKDTQKQQSCFLLLFVPESKKPHAFLLESFAEGKPFQAS